MRSKAEKYYESVIGDAPPFRRWPFRRLAVQRDRWRVRVSTEYVWVSALKSKLTNVEVHSGTSLRARRRGNRRSRARRVVFYLTLPPYRNYRVSSVKRLFSEQRTLLDKCETGARHALEHGLTFCVVPEIAAQLKDRGMTLDNRYLLTLPNESSGTDS